MFLGFCHADFSKGQCRIISSDICQSDSCHKAVQTCINKRSCREENKINGYHIYCQSLQFKLPPKPVSQASFANVLSFFCDPDSKLTTTNRMDYFLASSYLKHLNAQTNWESIKLVGEVCVKPYLRTLSLFRSLQGITLYKLDF